MTSILIFVLVSFYLIYVPAWGAESQIATPGAWFEASPLHEARYLHTATLLLDGRVLVAGGALDETHDIEDKPLPLQAIASTEIYDPSTDSWTITASMSFARYNHTATLLPDGRVLVVGGKNLTTELTSVEIFDPTTETWSTTANLALKRLNHTATMLLDGRILVAGGTSSGTSITGCEIFDPATQTWSSTGNMIDRRSRHTATLLGDGRVLVASGWTTFIAGGDQVIPTAEIYDPGTGQWSMTGSLVMGEPTKPLGRQDHTATLLPDGRVLVTGGDNGGGSLEFTEVYDPQSEEWTGVLDMNHSMSNHTATLLPDGRVLVVSGVNSSGKFSYTLSVEAFDPITDTWSNLAVLTSENTRWYHTSTLLPDGRVLVAGGLDDKQPEGVPMTSAMIFDSGQPGWDGSGSLNVARQDQTTTLLPDGSILAIGGEDDTGFLNSVEKSSINGLTWNEVDSLNASRARHTATLLQNGFVLVAGGENGSGALNSSEEYDPSLDTWQTVGSLSDARYDHTATGLPDGRVLAAGGTGVSGSLATAEIYSPSTKSWSGTNDMTNARSRHTATLLPDQRVLVAGGGDGGAVATAEFYNPSDGTWSATGGLNHSRYDHSATLLADGKVLVAGGFDGTALASVETFDPATGVWSIVAPMGTARYDHTAVLLPDNRVLVSGGRGVSGLLSSAEIYDPLLDEWTSFDSPGSERAGHTAVLQNTGQVLLVGGEGMTVTLDSVETFDRGLGFDESWRPVVSTCDPEIWIERAFTCSGSGFRGYLNSEASSGGTNSSATNHPVTQLRRLDNGQTLWLQQAGNFNAASTTLKLPASMKPGYIMVTVYVNAIPSTSVILKIIDAEKVYLPLVFR